MQHPQNTLGRCTVCTRHEVCMDRHDVHTIVGEKNVGDTEGRTCGVLPRGKQLLEGNTVVGVSLGHRLGGTPTTNQKNWTPPWRDPDY